MFMRYFFNYRPWFDGGDPIIPGTPPAASGGAGGNADDKKTFTQAELDALFGDRAKRAADKATADLLTALGVKDADELKTKLTKAAELEAAQLTALQKAEKLAADEKARADKLETEAKTATDKANETLKRAAVIAQAANFHDANEAWLHVDKTKLTVTADGAVEGAKEAVEAVVKAKPHLVKVEGDRRGTPRPGANGKLTNKEVKPFRVSL